MFTSSDHATVAAGSKAAAAPALDSLAGGAGRALECIAHLHVPAGPELGALVPSGALPVSLNALLSVLPSFPEFALPAHGVALTQSCAISTPSPLFSLTRRCGRQLRWRLRDCFSSLRSRKHLKVVTSAATKGLCCQSSVRLLPGGMGPGPTDFGLRSPDPARHFANAAGD
jgi:hypothetical protein